MTLLEMSVSGAVMIAAIIVIRSLTINRLPKRTFPVLWSIVLLRLLIPISLPSRFSVYTITDSLLRRHSTDSEMTQNAFVGADSILNVIPSGESGQAIVEPLGFTISPWQIVWCLGAFLCAMFFAISYVRYHQVFRASLPVDNAFAENWKNAHLLRRRVAIRKSDRVISPLTYGVIRPVILMPDAMDWTDAETLKYILAHELVHIRCFDTATKFALAAAVCVHWFNPLVWMMYFLSGRDMELACDESVVRQFGENSRSAYALTLISMEEQKSGLTPFCSGFSENTMEERIRSIMKFRKTTTAAIITAIILVCGVTVAFATSSDGNAWKEMVKNYNPENVAESLDRSYHISDRVDFSEEAELLRDYEKHGVSYDAAGKMYYQGRAVRYFWDGYDVLEKGAVIGQSIRYEYLNSDGAVDVHVLRDVEQTDDGGAWVRGIAGIEPYSQEEFDSRDINELANRPIDMQGTDSVETYAKGEEAVEMTVSDAENTDVGGSAPVFASEAVSVVKGDLEGSTNADYFRQFESYGIRYEEIEGEDRTSRIVTFNGIPVKTFIDVKPNGGVTQFASTIEEGITVHTFYSSGELAGLAGTEP